MQADFKNGYVPNVLPNGDNILVSKLKRILK